MAFPLGRFRFYALAVAALSFLCLLVAAALVAVMEPMPVSGMQDAPFTAGPVGDVVVLYGRQPVEFGDPKQHNWMYFVFMCPDAQRDPDHSWGSDGISHDLMSIPKFTFDWPTRAGATRMAIRWNQWLDRISIGGQKRSRKDGNVFAVTISGDGAVTVQQCGSLGPDATLKDALRQVQQKLPDNKLAASIVL